MLFLCIFSGLGQWTTYLCSLPWSGLLTIPGLLSSLLFFVKCWGLIGLVPIKFATSVRRILVIIHTDKSSLQFSLRKLFFQQTGTTTENHNQYKHRVMNLKVYICDTCPHLKLRKHCKLRGRKAVRARGLSSLVYEYVS